MTGVVMALPNHGQVVEPLLNERADDAVGVKDEGGAARCAVAGHAIRIVFFFMFARNLK